MKKFFVLLNFLCLMTIGLCNAQNLATTSSGKNPMTFAISGDTLVVKLQLTSTTGYTWDYAIKKKKVLELKSQEKVESSGVKFGGSGVQQYVFGGLKSGTTKVTFDYARRFKDKNPQSAGVRILEVTVNKDKTLTAKEVEK